MATRVTVVDGTTLVGIHGPNDSINVVVHTNPTPPLGVYHPCGAFNVVLSGAQEVYHTSGAFNATDLGSNIYSFGPWKTHGVSSSPPSVSRRITQALDVRITRSLDTRIRR